MIRKANAHWEGTLKDGKGHLSLESGMLEKANYSYRTRFESGEQGTNPEELLASAHAGCFTMQVAALLTKKGYPATTLDTEAAVTMENLEIKSVHLKITGLVPGITSVEFAAITKDAEQNCIISKVLVVPITSEVHFAGEDV